MDDLMQNFAGGRNHRIQELISGTDPVLKRPADWLLKVNLPPLLGRRDAAFDIAEKLICEGDFANCKCRFEVYWKISRLLKQVCRDSRQITLMLCNPDTRERERRLLALNVMLDTLGASLANFFELRDMMEKDIFHDAMSIADGDESKLVFTSFSNMENDLLARMQEGFRRSHWRVVRYRTYAEKSFSAVNAERYRKAYSTCVRHNESLFKQLGTDLLQIQL